MGFLKKFFSKKVGDFSVSRSPHILWLYVQCGKCGQKLKLAVNKNTDLEDQYRAKGETGPAYILRKEAMDDKCFTKMLIYMEFDFNKNILSQEVTGGQFISQEEFKGTE